MHWVMLKRATGREKNRPRLCSIDQTAGARGQVLESCPAGGGVVMFVQIHTLRDYSTALPNRGQDGLAKRTIYGGIERQRISSQSFKAAMRDNLTLVRTDKAGSVISDTMKDLAERLGLGMSVRSALIGD